MTRYNRHYDTIQVTIQIFEYFRQKLYSSSTNARRLRTSGERTQTEETRRDVGSSDDACTGHVRRRWFAGRFENTRGMIHLSRMSVVYRCV